MPINEKLFRIYRFKFYVNASHYVFFNGQQGETHPHTWEFGIEMLVKRDSVVQFNKYESAFTAFFDTYQNVTLNDVPPFDTIVPTLENIVDYFGSQLAPITRSLNAVLLELSGSETPTRSYAIRYAQEEPTQEAIEVQAQDAKGIIFDTLLDSIARG